MLLASLGNPALARAAMTTTVVGDAAITLRGQKEHLVFKGVRAQGAGRGSRRRTRPQDPNSLSTFPTPSAPWTNPGNQATCARPTPPSAGVTRIFTLRIPNSFPVYVYDITIHALMTPEEAYAEALNRFNCLSVDASRFSNQKREVNERPPSFRPLTRKFASRATAGSWLFRRSVG